MKNPNIKCRIEEWGNEFGLSGANFVYEIDGKVYVAPYDDYYAVHELLNAVLRSVGQTEIEFHAPTFVPALEEPQGISYLDA